MFLVSCNTNWLKHWLFTHALTADVTHAFTGRIILSIVYKKKFIPWTLSACIHHLQTSATSSKTHTHTHQNADQCGAASKELTLGPTQPPLEWEPEFCTRVQWLRSKPNHSATSGAESSMSGAILLLHYMPPRSGQHKFLWHSHTAVLYLGPMPKLIFKCLSWAHHTWWWRFNISRKFWTCK